MTSDLNMNKNNIINFGDPTGATDGSNKQYLEKSHVKPSHYNNEFKYLMTDKLRWTDLQADSFDITKIDNLMLQEGNYHQCNRKVLFTTMIKDQKGVYSYQICFMVCTFMLIYPKRVLISIHIQQDGQKTRSLRMVFSN